jgi:hypothetical protein
VPELRVPGLTAFIVYALITPLSLVDGMTLLAFVMLCLICSGAIYYTLGHELLEYLEV